MGWNNRTHFFGNLFWFNNWIVPSLVLSKPAAPSILPPAKIHSSFQTGPAEQVLIELGVELEIERQGGGILIKVKVTWNGLLLCENWEN
jgi:hypothetical protein